MAKQDVVKVPFSKDRLNLICLFHGVTQKELSKASGVSLSVIGKAKRNGMINQEYLRQLGLTLLVTPSFLMGDESLDEVEKAYTTIVRYIDEVLEEYSISSVDVDITIE